MKSEDSAARQTAVTEKHSHYTRPGSHGCGHSLPLSKHVHQFSEKRVSWEHRVRTGHRVAAREETVLFMLGKKTMKKKTQKQNEKNDEGNEGSKDEEKSKKDKEKENSKKEKGTREGWKRK